MTSCVKLWVLGHRTGKGVSQLSGRGGSTNPGWVRSGFRAGWLGG
jgi:hypothetical protein